MVVEIFILGRPGTGKSTAARTIARFAQNMGWSTYTINDYWILQEMFLADTAHEKFRPTESNGFDVIDFDVLDIVLKEVEKQARRRISVNKKEIVLIEFARDDYRKALKQFTSDFLHNAYFLLLDSDIETCIKRVHERVAFPISLDDHFISEEMMRTYYNVDNRLYFSFCLTKEYRITKCVEVIHNTGLPWDFTRKINQFISVVFKLEAPSAQRKPVSPNIVVPEVPALQSTALHKTFPIIHASP